jgi:hypothetical protein
MENIRTDRWDAEVHEVPVLERHGVTLVALCTVVMLGLMLREGYTALFLRLFDSL